MASPSEVSETQSAKVEVLESANIPVIPFAVSLPPSTLQDFDDPAPRASSFAMVGDNAIVGSIVLLNNSVMVWVGWGNIDLASSSDADAEVQSQSRFGKGAPFMGQVVVSMPRTNYKGAFGTGSKEPSCSQIVGSASSDDQMLASQMASRLTMRCSKAVFVSCQLSGRADGDGGGWTSGMNSEMISHKAAALAEKEVWRILQEHDKKPQGNTDPS